MPPDPRLRRDLNLLDAVGIGLGAVVGAGIFVVIGVAAGIAGNGLLIAILIAAIAATCNGISSAQLAIRYPTSGGTYEYGYEVLHPWAGYAAGWMFVVSKLAAGATVAIGLGHYVHQAFPQIPAVVTSLVFIAALTAANLIGIKKTGRLNTAIVLITFSLLGYFVFTGLGFIDASLPQSALESPPTDIIKAAAIIFFAFTGYARIATLAEEVRDPQRTIPLAVVATIVLSGSLYLLIALVGLAAVGPQSLAESTSPLSTAASAIGAPGVVAAIAIAALTAMLGVLLSQILGVSRVLLAMSRRGDLPPILKGVSASSSVPAPAVLATGGIIALIAVFGTLLQAISMAAFAILLYYAITNLAALRMTSDRPWFLRRYAVIGLIFCLGLAAFLDARTIVTGLAILATGLTFRFARPLWLSSETASTGKR